MKDIQNAIAHKLELLRNIYPKIGYQFGFGRNNFKYYIQLDFSAQHLSNDDKFNNFIADISIAIEEQFVEYSFVFFFEKTSLIKTVIETYTPAANHSQEHNKFIENAHADNNSVAVAA